MQRTSTVVGKDENGWTRIQGAYGTATELGPIDKSQVPNWNPDWDGMVATWLLNVPIAHPLWHQYIMMVVHLRDIEGQSRPPYRKWPDASHEIMVFALDPKHPETAETLHDRHQAGGQARHLHPGNIAAQARGLDDTQARRLALLLVRATLDGYLIIEPSGIRGAREQWDRSIEATAQHLRDGYHADPEE